MKFKLLKNLPFAKKGDIFETRFCTGRKWGVDLGTTYYKEGGSSHNGIRVFDSLEEKFITRLSKGKHYKKWIKSIKE